MIFLSGKVIDNIYYPNNMIDEKLKYRLDGVRAGILLYAPVLMYLFLKRQEEGINSNKKFDVKEIAGRSVNEWPSNVQEDFEKLFKPDEKLIRLQKEFIYFLIFVYFGAIFNYLEDQSNNGQKIVLDYLFDIFDGGDAPWLRDLDSDAFNKYVSASDNFFMKFSNELSSITGEEDALFLHDFVTEAAGIFNFLIKPSVDKLMSDDQLN